MSPTAPRLRAALAALVLLALLAPPASAGPLDESPRLTAVTPRATTPAGGTATFDLQVSNDGLWVGNVSLHASDPGGHFLLFLSRSDVLLGPGQSEDFTVTAYTPPDLVAGTYDINVTAVREGAPAANVTLHLDVTSSGQGIAPGFRLVVQDSRVMADQGSHAFFNLHVENGRGVDFEVNLSVVEAAPELWPWFMQSTLHVPANSWERTTLVVNTTQAPAGDYVLRLRAATTDGQLQAEALANLTVVEARMQPITPVSYGVELDPGFLPLTVTAGATAETTVTLRNVGDAPESTVLFGILDIDPGPAVTVAPQAPYVLQAAEEVLLTLRVTPPNDTAPGDYRYLLKAYPREDPADVAYANLTLTVLSAPPAEPRPPPANGSRDLPPPANDSRDPEPPANETLPPSDGEGDPPPTNDTHEDMAPKDPQASPAGETPPPEGGAEAGPVADQRAAAAAEGDTLLTRWAAEPRPLLAVAAVAAATAALAMRLRRESARYLALAPLAGLYTRLARSKVLDHETRDRIHELVLATPGIRYGELKRVTGLNAGALVHHLRTLERHQLVTSRREGTNRHFYPVGRRVPEPAPAPVTPMQARILDLLPEGGLTQREIAERVGLTQQGANYHVKTLERAGRVTLRMHEGQWRCYRAAPPSPEASPPARAAPPAPQRRA